ncbi:Uncharacterised protein [uncultured Ruminococcus sp.]|uniref:Uncharacterized protein n=1 Tax=Massiliimalia timonensis TaxID=1987501 RepID=A0A8J6TYW3_9FIRM|nr:hypothetical protein [Massiliimalia timonensis]MBC8610542.1 hypothetical protein [Massiliimalia timonensis]MBS7176201.1 hypothetical protein [Clostridiales bacterium]SCH88980.1 Uncharacterised protein [uncultured Clostridium sp.]SCI21635.1 Uncharacterised protein [uncultured Ruminococcus sp.]
MDDLLSKLQGILSSEEGQQQLKSVAEMLGMDGENNSQMPDLSQLSGMLGGASQPKQEEAPSSGAENKLDLSGLDLNMLMQVQKIVSSMNMEDNNTRLLQALKPHFSDSRQQKIDKAIRMLQLFSLLPMIQESGLLGGLLGDGRK